LCSLYCANFFLPCHCSAQIYLLSSLYSLYCTNFCYHAHCMKRKLLAYGKYCTVQYLEQ
jgi:hypothetical protein